MASPSTRRHWNPRDLALAAAMRGWGWSHHRIGREIDRDASTVNRALRRTAGDAAAEDASLQAPLYRIATYYEEAGSGEPLILICGLSADLQVWRFQVPELSKRFRVICYDNRGAGRTTAPDETYSIAAMADDLAALLDHLQINSAHVLGWSMGGLIAQQFALTRPLRVRKLILMSTTGESDGFFRLAIKNWMNIRRSDMSFEQIVRFVSRWGYSPAFYDDDQAYEKLIQVMAANPYAQKAHAFLRQADALLAHSMGEAARDIRAETLVMAGFDEFPDEYNRAILDFLP